VGGPTIVGVMTRTQRLAERAITFAIAEPNEDLAVARLVFLAHGDHAALDQAIEACLARRQPGASAARRRRRLPGYDGGHASDPKGSLPMSKIGSRPAGDYSAGVAFRRREPAWPTFMQTTSRPWRCCHRWRWPVAAHPG
jgi:hypothetical protein